MISQARANVPHHALLVLLQKMASSKIVILLLPLAIRLSKVKSHAKRVVVLAKHNALHQWTDFT